MNLVLERSTAWSIECQLSLLYRLSMGYSQGVVV